MDGFAKDFAPGHATCPMGTSPDSLNAGGSPEIPWESAVTTPKYRSRICCDPRNVAAVSGLTREYHRRKPGHAHAHPEGMLVARSRRFCEERT
jgi:hypothetical protein